MSFHHSLIFAVLLFLGKASVGYAADVQPLPPVSPARDLIVVDATGKKVGEMLITSQFFVFNPFVALKIGKQTVPFHVNKDGLSNNTSSDVQFESADCSGTGFFYPEASIIWPLVAAGILYTEEGVRTGNILYLEDLTGTPKSIDVGSSLRIENGVVGECVLDTYPGNTEVKLIPTLPRIDLDKVFTPPYRLR